MRRPDYRRLLRRSRLQGRPRSGAPRFSHRYRGGGWDSRDHEGRRIRWPDQPRYLLLLFEGPSYDSLSASHSDRVAEYAEWARGLATRGQLADGAELSPVEQRLGSVPDGSDGRHAISGYFIVIARDAAEARAIAETCPHLRHGGGVSIRPLS